MHRGGWHVGRRLAQEDGRQSGTIWKAFRETVCVANCRSNWMPKPKTRFGEKHVFSPRPSACRAVREITPDGSIVVHASQNKAESGSGTPHGAISKCCRGELKTAGGPPVGVCLANSEISAKIARRMEKFSKNSAKLGRLSP